MAFAGNVDELALLQTIRLKGQVTADVLAAQLGVALASAEAARDALLAQGKAEETGDGAFALTDAGVAELGDQLDAERVSIDEDSIAEIRERFLELDGPLRELVEGDPNVEALAALDRKAQAGDAAWIAAPEIASYVTVWGEIARELRGACGLDEDAAA